MDSATVCFSANPQRCYRIVTADYCNLIMCVGWHELYELYEPLTYIGDVENDPCGSGAPDHEEVGATGAEGVRAAGALLARRRPPRVWAAAEAAERKGRGMYMYCDDDRIWS